MYVKKLVLENVGPISKAEFDFPFDENENPKPVILVGENGSGKSIALSFVVNALLAARQAVFEDNEVEKGKVYKLRSSLYIGPSQPYYFCQVEFEEGFAVTEWQLNEKRIVFEEKHQFCSIRKSWAAIPEIENNLIIHDFMARKNDIRKLLENSCSLYFPPNRFEEPAWLNYENLIAKAHFSKLKNLAGHSNRQVIQYASLSTNKDWLMDVLFDQLVNDIQVGNLPSLQIPNESSELRLFLGYEGESSILYRNITELLKVIFHKDENLRFGFGPRQARRVTLVKENGETLQNIFQLSTGESLVLNLGLSILRDYDLCQAKSSVLSEIKGLVVIDEVDLHLHADFQNTVLPKLLRLFPKVQFLMTSHSPLFLMGMQKEFGKGGFLVISMPKMKESDPENFSEFEQAYRIYKDSVTYNSDLDASILKASNPAIFLEGPIDIKYLKHASKILGEEILLQKISLFDGDGFGNLNNVWRHFNTRLAAALPRIVALIYDCDTQKSNAENGNLKRRLLPEVPGNPVRKGIENLFSRETLEKAIVASPAFIDIIPAYTKKVRGNDELIEAVWEINPSEKANLCNWLIENGTAKDFVGFGEILDIIREFVPQDQGQNAGQ